MPSVTVTFEVPDGIDSNEERAAMVRPFLEAYRSAYYHLDGEDLRMVAGDLVANLMHCVDALPRDDDNDSLGVFQFDGPGMLDMALTHYEAELAEAEYWADQLAQEMGAAEAHDNLHDS